MNYRITVTPYIKNTYFGNEVKRWRWNIEVEREYQSPVYEFLEERDGYLRNVVKGYNDPVKYWSTDFDHHSYEDADMEGENCKSAEEADQKARTRGP